MKKLIALVMALMLLAFAAQAAEWGEGLGPNRPYSGYPEVNLDETMGYIVLYPRTKLPTKLFCDVLEIYLPREDVAINEGTLTLMSVEDDQPVEITTVDFSDESAVGVRPMTEQELQLWMWGSGVCVYARITPSLELNKSYYVTMDEGCFTAKDGELLSLAIVNPEAWNPLASGDYGISSLYYSAPIPVEPTDEEAAEEAEEPAEEVEEDAEESPIAYKLDPENGDTITFDLLMGGNAVYAVVYTENDSVMFETIEYTESGTVTGTVTDAENLNWGVVFLDENGTPLDSVTLGAKY